MRPAHFSFSMKYVPFLVILPLLVVFGFLAWIGVKQKDEDAVPLLGIASLALIVLPLLVFTNGS